MATVLLNHMLEIKYLKINCWKYFETLGYDTYNRNYQYWSLRAFQGPTPLSDVSKVHGLHWILMNRQRKDNGVGSHFGTPGGRSQWLFGCRGCQYNLISQRTAKFKSN